MTSRTPWGEITAFTVVACGLGWLVNLPRLLGGPGTAFGLSPAAATMLTPAAAALLVLAARRRRALPAAFGARPLRPVGRLAAHCAAGLALPVLLGLAATLLAAAFGVLHLDLSAFSLLRTQIGAPPGAGFPAVAPVLLWLAGMLGQMAAFLPFAYGEECGWRGYLMPTAGGGARAVLVTTVAWALWHAPLMLDAPGGVVAVFLLGLPLHAAIYGWLRAASGSVWPAVLAHLSNNSISLVPYYLFGHATERLDPVVFAGSTGGLVGVLACAVLVAALASTGRLRFPAPPERSRQLAAHR